MSRSALNWWVISGDDLLAALKRAHSGKDPDLLYAELYANSDVEQVAGDTTGEDA